MSDLEPLAEGLEKVFGRLGLPDPRVMSAIIDEWDTLAGTPWKGNSKPVVVRGRTLVVEATGAGRPDVHPGSATYGLETLEDRDVARLI